MDLSDPAVQFGLAITQQRSDWLRDFVAQGRDPRELPIEVWEVDEFGPARELMTLEEVRRQSRLVLLGRVVSTTYIAVPEELGHPKSIATVDVERVAKGTIRTRSIEVVQSGGPIWNGGEARLVQFPRDPLLLPDDQVILILVPARPKADHAAGRYSTLWRAGIYLVTPYGVYANGRNDLAGAVSGRSPDEVLALFD